MEEEIELIKELIKKYKSERDTIDRKYDEESRSAYNLANKKAELLKNILEEIETVKS